MQSKVTLAAICLTTLFVLPTAADAAVPATGRKLVIAPVALKVADVSRDAIEPTPSDAVRAGLCAAPMKNGLDTVLCSSPMTYRTIEFYMPLIRPLSADIGGVGVGRDVRLEFTGDAIRHPARNENAIVALDKAESA